MMYDVKISDIETKYFTTSDYNRFTSEIINKKIKKDLDDQFHVSQ